MEEGNADRQSGSPEPRARLLAVLSNEVRVEVLANLAVRRQCVSELASRLELDGSTVSHALQVLRKAGLVQHKAAWRQRIYRLSKAVRARKTDSTIQIEIMCIGGRVNLELPRPPE